MDRGKRRGSLYVDGVLDVITYILGSYANHMAQAGEDRQDGRVNCGGEKGQKFFAVEHACKMVRP